MTLRDVAVREAQTTRGLHGWVMYVCLFHKNASQISHFFLFFHTHMALLQYSSLQEARELPVQRCPGPCDFLSLMWFWIIFHSWPYLRFSHTSRIPTSAGGNIQALFFCHLKKLRPSRHYSLRKRYTVAKPQMQVIYLLVGKCFFTIVIPF